MENIALNVLWVFAAYCVLEILFRRFRPPTASKSENWLDLLGLSQAWFVAGPLAAWGGSLIQRHFLPEYADAWAGTHWALQVLAFLVLDDMVQYWWHRLSHRYAWMWGLHKFHHSPPYMSVRIIWRDGFFHTLLMPNLYLSSTLIYLGFGEVYIGYQITKLVVTMGAHSELRWDRWLYRYPVLAPLAWVVERTISTPATHFAHHAALDDPVGNPNGNFGNLMFFWDVLFGSARITRQYPQRFGLPEEPDGKPDPWYVLSLYPLFRARPKE
jgi:sterol desaturase/sphingolipid hydroxylase (fatty acid hydroxylase superfamily)